MEVAFKAFTKTISNQFRVFEDKSTKDSIINLWIINSINQYFYLSSNLFENRSSIITKFEFFGKILNAIFKPMLEPENTEFLQYFKNNYEIYTVLVLPPKRFLNYDAGERSNSDWDEFIKTTIESKNAELKINRHFLSLNINQLDKNLVRKIFGEESVNFENEENAVLEKENFKQQLKLHLLLPDSGYVPLKQDGQNSQYILDLKENIVKKNDSNKIESLRNFLDSIHYDNGCKVIELEVPNFTDDDTAPLDRFKGILWDEKSLKPIDYFAIREKNSKEWLFCYRTVFDKTLDFANIQINHKLQSNKNEWVSICNNLDKIFMPNDKNEIKNNEELGTAIYSIKSYGEKQ